MCAHARTFFRTAWIATMTCLTQLGCKDIFTYTVGDDKEVFVDCPMYRMAGLTDDLSFGADPSILIKNLLGHRKSGDLNGVIPLRLSPSLVTWQIMHISEFLLLQRFPRYS